MIGEVCSKTSGSVLVEFSTLSRMVVVPRLSDLPFSTYFTLKFNYLGGIPGTAIFATSLCPSRQDGSSVVQRSTSVLAEVEEEGEKAASCGYAVFCSWVVGCRSKSGKTSGVSFHQFLKEDALAKCSSRRRNLAEMWQCALDSLHGRSREELWRDLKG